jgi:hypothetical protein
MGYTRPDYVFMRTTVDLFLKGESFNSSSSVEYESRLNDTSGDYVFPVSGWEAVTLAMSSNVRRGLEQHRGTHPI